jgi:uncharacterized RDD family membrane protein YckC
MEYIVLGSDGKEYGPVDQETLYKWIEHGRVSKDTQIRNALMKKWNIAGEMPSLNSAFKDNEELRKQESGLGGKLLDSLIESHTVSKSGEPKKSTAFIHKHKPQPANVMYRIYSFLTDALILSAVGITFFFMMASLTGTWVNVESAHLTKIKDMEKKAIDQAEKIKDTSSKETKNLTEKDIREGKDKIGTAENSEEESDLEYETDAAPKKFPLPVKFKGTYYFFTFVFFILALLYYGIGLGIFAQTVGMWYWGLIIVKGHNDEAYPLRTFAYAMLALIFAPITPFVVLLNPIHRSIQGYLTGTRIVSVTAQSEG